MWARTKALSSSLRSITARWQRGSTREEQGFTLIELLIVIVVLGILAGIVIFALGSTTAQAAVAACNADAHTVETAVSAYDATTGGTTPATVTLLTTASAQNGNLVYLHSMPNSPDYTITLVNGTVMIAAPSSAIPVAYGTDGACANAGTSATTTTTTTPPSNGVVATPTTNTYGGYGGQDILAVSNTKAITALTITIKVAQTTGVTPNGGYNSFPGGIAATTYGTSGGGTLTSTYVLNSGQSIPAGSPSGSFAAQYAGTGSARVQTDDTWTVVSTSNGLTSTLSGHF